MLKTDYGPGDKLCRLTAKHVTMTTVAMVNKRPPSPMTTYLMTSE